MCVCVCVRVCVISEHDTLIVERISTYPHISISTYPRIVYHILSWPCGAHIHISAYPHIHVSHITYHRISHINISLMTPSHGSHLSSYPHIHVSHITYQHIFDDTPTWLSTGTELRRQSP